MAVMDILNSVVTAQPIVSVIVVAIIVTTISLLVTLLFTDRKKMAELKEKQKACQALFKQHKGNEKKMLEIQKEMMACSGEMMRMSFKPMLVTLIPFLILFAFLRSLFVPIMGNSWIWYYIITSIVWSMILRKPLKM